MSTKTGNIPIFNSFFRELDEPFSRSQSTFLVCENIIFILCLFADNMIGYENVGVGRCLRRRIHKPFWIRETGGISIANACLRCAGHFRSHWTQRNGIRMPFMEHFGGLQTPTTCALNGKWNEQGQLISFKCSLSTNNWEELLSIFLQSIISRLTC